MLGSVHIISIDHTDSLLHDHILSNYECSSIVNCEDDFKCQPSGWFQIAEINWVLTTTPEMKKSLNLTSSVHVLTSC